MADKEIVAATLAAGLIAGRHQTAFHSLAGTTVELYYQILEELEKPRDMPLPGDDDEASRN